ncbi:MAG: hypothetical protein ACRDRQ_14220 [Pseudonocardiaceae bacterium]
MSEGDEIPAPPRWYGSDPHHPPSGSSPRPPAGDRDHGAAQPPEELVGGVPPVEEPGGSALGPDASVGEVARAARAAFVGRDLIRARPGLWPFGPRARARQERNREVAEEARRRRGQFRAAFESGAAPVTGRPVRWRPVERRANAVVIASLAGVVLGVFVLSVWFSGRAPAQQPAPAAAGIAVTSRSSAPPGVAEPVPGAGVSLPGLPPIPPGGVAPIRPPVSTTVNPALVRLAAPPVGEVTAAELGSPEGAVAAWLARWCPYSHTEPFGAAERRARSAMTAAGWAVFDPAGNDRAQRSWQTIVAEAQTARCAVPTALVSPEAPRSQASAIVIGQVQRVITAGDGARWVDTLTGTRIVLRGADGLWRVDTATTGG